MTGSQHNLCSGLLLLTPAKPDVERDAVTSAWEEAGGTVLRLDRFWDPPAVDVSRVRLYGNDSFCLVLEQKLGLKLISPSDDLLMRVGHRWLQREVHVRVLSEAEHESFPRFVKPLVPKLFRAGVYDSSDALRDECRGLTADTHVYVSEIVRFESEVRSFILDGEVLTAAIYEGQGDLQEAQGFLQRLARSVILPRTCALDAGFIKERGWALIEANATWGAGLNGCDPHMVVQCLEAAVAA